jgi:hypothetical protein
MTTENKIKKRERMLNLPQKPKWDITRVSEVAEP